MRDWREGGHLEGGSIFIFQAGLRLSEALLQRRSLYPLQRNESESRRLRSAGPGTPPGESQWLWEGGLLSGGTVKRWRWRRVILRGGGGDSREGRCQRGGTGINLGPAPWWEIRNREGSGWGLEFRSCKYRLECGATGHTASYFKIAFVCLFVLFVGVGWVCCGICVKLVTSTLTH